MSYPWSFSVSTRRTSAVVRAVVPVKLNRVLGRAVEAGKCAAHAGGARGCCSSLMPGFRLPWW